jgi:choline transport protein
VQTSTMATPAAEKRHSKSGPSDLSPSSSTPLHEPDDSDAIRFAALGYEQSMERKFSVWSIMGVGFSLTNSWFGLSSALVTGMNSEDTALVVYGVILIALVSSCVAISLSKLASAMPSAGGKSEVRCP